MTKCEYQEICPTTNYWVEKKKSFIEEVCNTSECINCIQRQDFKSTGVTKGDTNWKEMVAHFKKRREEYPPYGVISP